MLLGRATLASPTDVRTETADGVEELETDVVLLATGATPRVMDTARPDGERILTWQQLYDLKALPERLVVVGSGVTGAELAQAYLGLGSDVVLVSSRDRVLPGEDPDAAQVIEDVFTKRGMEVLGRSRMAAVERTAVGVVVRLEDGREVVGSHALLAVGSVPQTRGIGLEEVGVELTPTGHVQVDKVSRTSVRGVYGAGDCTGVLPLASVAAMQGRIAMSHALGDAVAPLNLGRRLGEHLHRPRDRDGRGLPTRRRRAAGRRGRAHPPPGPQRAGEDARHHRRFRQALRAEGVGGGHRRGRRGARGRPSSSSR